MTDTHRKQVYLDALFAMWPEAMALPKICYGILEAAQDHNDGEIDVERGVRELLDRAQQISAHLSATLPEHEQATDLSGWRRRKNNSAAAKI